MSLRILIVGDHDERVIAHRANPLSLELAARALGQTVTAAWPGTEAIAAQPAMIAGFDGIWCVPDSPYRSTGGALAAIRFAREQHRPFLGTCGGYQHALLEYARNVLRLEQADHEELEAASPLLLISRLACSMVEVHGSIRLQPGSRAAALARSTRLADEAYHCSFGLNPQLRSLFDSGPLRITGEDDQGEARIIELDDHPFFMATMFQPERRALRGELHPLVGGFVEAAGRARSRLIA